METKAVTTTNAASCVAITAGGQVEFNTLAGLMEFAKVLIAGGFAPKGMDKPESCAIAVLHGKEIGLNPMQSLQSLGVINGRPGIYGDAALALVRASGLMDDYTQSVEGEGDKRVAVVTSKRKGGGTITSRFSVSDAKTAVLWGKSGPWSQYPERMLIFRARGFNLRDNFGDVLKGLQTVEELRDMPKEVTPDKVSKPLFGGVTKAEDVTYAEQVAEDGAALDAQAEDMANLAELFTNIGMPVAEAYCRKLGFISEEQTYVNLTAANVSTILSRAPGFTQKANEYAEKQADAAAQKDVAGVL